ncbi:MAG: hypothetical protein AB8G99_22390 [Planctomycetaceae bacterium]
MATSDPAELPHLARTILDGVADLCEQATKSGQPLEVDPNRGHLFEYFVTAEASGYLKEDAECDLSADGLCHLLGTRWGVADAARESTARQEKMAPESLAKMRLLWSLMRMWMEWTYAWSRWNEFHSARTDDS